MGVAMGTGLLVVLWVGVMMGAGLLPWLTVVMEMVMLSLAVTMDEA